MTPRLETRAIVEAHELGIVAQGDTVDDLANALRQLVLDPARARRIGEHARRVAVDVYDWGVVGDRLASEILVREGSPGRA